MKWLRKWLPKWLQIAGWLLFGLVLPLGTAWLAVPSVLKSQGEQRLSAMLGRAVSIGKVDFKPWSLELTVSQLQISGLANSAAPLLRAQRLYANVDARSLIRLAPVIEALEIDAPRIHLTRTAAGH